ncbi:MAG: hypothetical protein J6U25_03395, partial [Clostridia bacterium]|nr:hypothetical protein [Clostridia bacterium]
MQGKKKNKKLIWSMVAIVVILLLGVLLAYSIVTTFENSGTELVQSETVHVIVFFFLLLPLLLFVFLMSLVGYISGKKDKNGEDSDAVIDASSIEGAVSDPQSAERAPDKEPSIKEKGNEEKGEEEGERSRFCMLKE